MTFAAWTIAHLLPNKHPLAHYHAMPLIATKTHNQTATPPHRRTAARMSHTMALWPHDANAF